MEHTLDQKNRLNAFADFVKAHQFAIGFLMVFLAVADLWFVMPNMYPSLPDWRVGTQFFVFSMPEWIFTVPAMLVICLIGTLMLSIYGLRDIQSGRVDNKEKAAVLATALGFTYQVIGAWPFFNQGYPWPWQQLIARYGNLLVLPLFFGSLLALIVGAASMYIHSKIYRQKHPETQIAP